ncbi:type II toxin-antitoxin system HicB family antitoxin [Neisseria wadsworthii]|uniref:Phage associated protein n=1 Tax=Neisseria wadsworthii 9715 TaxID=1030841 RepID=G4CPI9_9NEIS|nr:type II toxin-antitoxin system HicB family antitoxin [Neisseria wadsworthii]EGZ47752.1 phage associated protein [Neisseria wadsworthii 9715]
MIYYPVAIFRSDGEAGYGVIIPDLPGCYPVGDTVEEALADAKGAALFHIEGSIEEGLGFETHPKSIEEHRANPDYAEAVLWAMIEIDETAFTKQTRFNVSWPEYLLEQVDRYAAANHETRSGFLAKAAQSAMRRNAVK